MTSPPGWIYGKILDLRNRLYETGTFKSVRLSAPTISVGNITVGGTGKTPLVRYIADILAEKGESVCIISRGYKRSNERKRVQVSDGAKLLADVEDAGDEPFELATHLLGKAIVIADADRAAAGAWAAKNFDISVFLLDDAFQHRRVERDLDIVVIDGMNPFGNRNTMPSGILREHLKNLERADLIVISRSNFTPDMDGLTAEIRSHNAHCPIVAVKNVTKSATPLDEFPDGGSVPVLTGESSLAFCAVGNPDSFFDQVEADGYTISRRTTFRDHHKYKQRDIDTLQKAANEVSATRLLTTAKDAVKLRDLSFALPCYVIESGLEFDDEKKLRDKVYAVFD